MVLAFWFCCFIFSAREGRATEDLTAVGQYPHQKHGVLLIPSHSKEVGKVNSGKVQSKAWSPSKDSATHTGFCIDFTTNLDRLFY